MSLVKKNPGVHRTLRLHSICSNASRCLIGALVLIAVGCGSGEYNRRLEETVTRLNSTVDIASILYGAPTPLTDASGNPAGVSLQMPLFVVNAAGSDQPTGMTFPGFGYSYAVEGGHIYIGAVAADKGVNEAKAEAKKQIAQAISGADWSDAQVPTADDGSISIPRMSGLVNGNRFDVYMVTSGTHHVFIGWQAAADNSSFFQAADYSMGSVMISG